METASYYRGMRLAGLQTLLLLASVSVVLGAADPVIPVERARTAAVVTFYLENDFFGGNDQHYTNGAKLSWLSPDYSSWGQDGWREKTLEALPLVNAPATQKNFGVALGQNMYTPENTGRHVPDPIDRPYAGWSYLEFSLISRTQRVMDVISVQVGVVGRHSYAQETQQLVHGWINSHQPRGWAFQLKDEVGVNVITERRWRLFARSFDDTFGVDVVPHLGVSLGNVQTFANTGLTARFGLNLPNDFGVELLSGGAITNSPLNDRDPRVGSHHRRSLFVFGGVDGRAVARDIFLDGNTWEDSPSVEKERLVGDSYWGVGLVLSKWQITYTYVVRSKEFKAQRDVSQFGSITLSRAF